MRVLLLVALAWVVGSACATGDKPTNAGSTPSEASQTRTTDDDLAESLLLTKRDFPTSWVHRPPQKGEVDDGSEAFNTYGCPAGPLAGETGRAFGGEYSNENTTQLSINPTVYVFDSDAAAERATEEIYQRTKCVVEAIGDGRDIDATNALGKATIEELSPTDISADRLYRVAYENIYRIQSPPIVDVLWFDSAIVVAGRFVYEVDGFQRNNTFPPGLLKTYVIVARDRVEDAAAAP